MARFERDYQAALIDRISMRFPGCFVLKNDSQYLQGIPDLTVLHGGRWAALEVKRSENEPRQPNQQYYIDALNNMGGYAAFIYPENEAEVLDAVQRAFES
jgi:hypothetical protein